MLLIFDRFAHAAVGDESVRYECEDDDATTGGDCILKRMSHTESHGSNLKRLLTTTSGCDPDIYDADDCERWKGYGDCEEGHYWHSWMMDNCAATCCGQ